MEKEQLIQEVGRLLHEDEAKLLKEENRTLKAEHDKELTEKETEKLSKQKKPWINIPKRYILCFLVFWGFLLMNCERSCLSVAIVAMSSKRRVKVDGKWVTKVTTLYYCFYENLRKYLLDIR